MVPMTIPAMAPALNPPPDEVAVIGTVVEVVVLRGATKACVVVTATVVDVLAVVGLNGAENEEVAPADETPMGLQFPSA